MTANGPNPVLAPIRRWVLYSKTNLAISVAGSLMVLFAAGAVFGEDAAPQAAAAQGATEAVEVSAGADGVSYEVIEVSESLVAAKSVSWAAASAPATAMAYAHAFIDMLPSDSSWASNLSRHTASAPGEAVIAARPSAPIVITGPTVSEIVTDRDGVKTARVSVPTQAGIMAVSLSVIDVAGGQRWVVDTPLPTLDLSEVSKVAPMTSAAPKPSTSASAPAPTSTTAPSGSNSDDADTDKETSPPSSTALPTPVPGPIPIPELDTPIPGGR